MGDIVSNLLFELGPLPSSKVIEILRERGLSHEAARQRVARSECQRLQGVMLPRNQSFLFLHEDRRNLKFYEALSDALIETSSAAGVFLSGL